MYGQSPDPGVTGHLGDFLLLLFLLLCSVPPQDEKCATAGGNEHRTHQHQHLKAERQTVTDCEKCRKVA